MQGLLGPRVSPDLKKGHAELEHQSGLSCRDISARGCDVPGVEVERLRFVVETVANESGRGRACQNDAGTWLNIEREDIARHFLGLVSFVCEPQRPSSF